MPLVLSASAENLFGSESLVSAATTMRLTTQGIGLALVVILAGCATTSSPPNRPAEVQERAVLDGDSSAQGLLDQADISVERLPDTKAESPVVKKLLASANSQSRAGNDDGAANSLERALRIEPRNPLLWGRLAQIKFAQGDLRQAIQLAAKSNTLTGSHLASSAGTLNNDLLRRQNWNLMASSYERLGDADKAQRYRDKLRGGAE